MPRNPLKLRIYPSGKTTVVFYEDDGISEEYLGVVFSWTFFTSASASGSDVPIGAEQTLTWFDGQLGQRAYVLEFTRWPAAPTMVSRDGRAIGMSADFPTTEGWFYDGANKVLWVRFGPAATNIATAISIQ